jgi:ABC-2 type transport system permease protein
MVTRGVQEEKQSRVVEIVISSVKPFQLMMGKIIGIALVGLTQFAIWILLTVIITTISGQAISAGHPAGGMAGQSGTNQGELQHAILALGTLPIPLLVGMFLFYFLAGYLLYSSIFAAVASAVDSQADMSQFMLPISIPIIFSIASISSIIENPDGPFAFWMSIIPLTSPIVMMARIPFGVPTWQIALSMIVLVGSFILSTWMAAKIYRTGILMYGKKITWKELGKWLFYKG